MKKPPFSVTAGCGHIKPPSQCVARLGEQSSQNHEIRFAEQPSSNRHIVTGKDERDSTPRAEHGAGLAEDWREMSLGALWDYFNRPHKTPQTTIEAVLHSVRERGLEALTEPANIARLSGCDEMARAEINKRIARLLAAKEIAA
jgi:hypothetical protein